MNRLARDLDVVAVVREPKVNRPAESARTPEDEALMKPYFAARTAAERSMLPEGAAEPAAGVAVLDVAPGGINDPAIVGWLAKAGAEAAVVFGTSIIRAPLLGALPLVNIHLGVSPYYRGAATNFWAMYDERFHLVGATIHVLSEKVDAGPIIHHSLPEIVGDDTPHTLGTRVVAKAVEDLAVILQAPALPAAKPQWAVDNPRLCRRRDFTPDALRDLMARWGAGLLERELPRLEQSRSRLRYVHAFS